MASGFVTQHPWMTFFITLFAIGGVVSIAQAASPAATKLAGAPKGTGPKLPPKPVSKP
jgi:hypothetical protein